MGRTKRSIIPLLLSSLILTACGGGGENNSVTTSANAAASVAPQDTGVPQATGNTATDGFNWFNFRRRQLGIQAVNRNTVIDSAALGHSVYQRENDTITHEQTVGKPGFTGRTAGDRLRAAGYPLTSSAGFAYGEVISATTDTSGANAAEDLIAAIYHRFVIFEPMFKEAGVGSAGRSGGLTYFTTNFTALGLNGGLAQGNIVHYPVADQTRVPRNFFSDNESPDPVPNANEVGYPVSVHANITDSIEVQTFTITPRGGNALPARLLRKVDDPQTPESAAAIVPLTPLTAGTVYDVRFVGKVSGIGANNVPWSSNINRSWSFTTQ
ncbi:CAP domain-containing protein [Noviherbaspirillum aerium]|uniref:CAP domain-containing protein n=1 Tax=Noviherbaspirillum aerium TaxID=2588497 RepID=UPI00124C812C|nr:CAP domain-containing protein [Noviherbaspirillum aerium]